MADEAAIFRILVAADPSAPAPQAPAPAAAAPITATPAQPVGARPPAQPISAQRAPSGYAPGPAQPVTAQPAGPAARPGAPVAANPPRPIGAKPAGGLLNMLGMGSKAGAAGEAAGASGTGAIEAAAAAGGMEGMLAAAGPVGAVVAAVVQKVQALGAVAQRNAGSIGTAIGSGGDNAGAVAAGVGLDLAGEMVPGLKPVIGAVEVASKIFAAAAQASAVKIKTLGAAASAVAQGDLLGAQQAGLERQKMLDDAVPIIGGIISYFRGTAEKMAAISAVRDIHGAIEAKSATLAPYSGQLAGARAMAKAQEIQSNVNLATQLGPSLARATEAKSNYDTAVNQALAPFARQMAEQYSQLLESGNLNAETAKKMTEALGDQTKLLELISEDTAASKELQKAIKENLKRIKEGGLGAGKFTAQSIVEELTQGANFLDPMPLDNDPVLAPGFAQQADLQPLGGF